MRCANPVRSYNAFFRQNLTIQVPPEVPPENQRVRISSYHGSYTLVFGRHVSDRGITLSATTPDLTYLRQLLGDAWVEVEVLGRNPSHWLGLWQKKNSNNIWVKYAEGLTRAILTNKNISVDSEGLAKKLRSPTDCVSTLAEMESAIFLADKGFTVTLEPTAPLKGPDLRADWDRGPYFVEVRTVGFSEDEDRRDSVTNEIFATLNTTPSRYRVTLTVGVDYEPGSDKLRHAIAAVLTGP